ncbi:DUF2778 domain-containing protein [Pararhizobium sp. BT-229]|uniref:DUF2778 domain-containing protein n=1 Tax=Pararhizobium sp. BT-229 TaxID=2986923 RepID=UPI0021F6DD02|nr:DUF2778 domain-containing protein [Pararhizobium sp. BT-229]MCV9960985.1 DUF2778 domain-containing protein [Pararhizobium sp. BT-229]
MAFAVKKFSHVATSGKARERLKTHRFVSGATILGIGIAASIWALATFAAMHAIGPSLPSGGQARLDTSLGLNAIVRAAPKQQRLVRLTKFSRLTVMPRIQLAARTVPQKSIAAIAMAKPAVDFAEKTQVLALAKAAAARGGDDLITGTTPVVASALVENVSLKEQGLAKPFNLVMQEPASSLNGMLPDLGPLPLAKPRSLADNAGKPADRARKPAMKELAYAKPDLPMDDDNEIRPTFRGRKGVAYYDISAGVVYMPNGEKLEAHSGIGKMRDNPNYVHVKMKGPTPPGTYKVTMREALFHGVEAVRLTPVNGVAPHGRVGLLAHSYLLRTRGDSHGCVAFEEYPRFLKAFKRGEISHMVIVKSMKGMSAPKRTLASLFSKGA